MAECSGKIDVAANCGVFVPVCATQHLEGNNALRYAEKLTKLTITDPYTAPQVLFKAINVTEELPELQYFDIYNYLISFPSVYTGESLKAYKSLEGYRYHQSGWVSGVMVWQPPGKNLSIVTSKVKHSMRLNEPPLKPWIALAADGIVQAAHCNCMAGLGEACSHVAATLFHVLAAVNLRSEVSVTSKQCKWSAPGAKPIQKIEAKQGRHMSFAAPHSKKQKRCDTDVKRKEATIPRLTAEEETALYTAIASTVGEKRPCKPAILSIIPGHSQRYIPRTANINLPQPLTSLYDPEARHLSTDDLRQKCEEVFRNLQISAAQADLVEKETVLQAKSKVWFQQRAGRITASIFKQACQTSTEKPAKSLVTRICDPDSCKFSSNATKWGCSHEAQARDLYHKYSQSAHPSLTLKGAGFRIHPTYPFLGATPDGYVTCDCCGDGIIEIKCPYCAKGQSVEEAAECHASFCLKKDANGLLTLKRDHPYYYQVQAQLNIIEVSYCDFIVYTVNGNNDGFHVERIHVDEMFFNEALEKIVLFYKAVILPNLVAKTITCPILKEKDNNSSVERVCYCKEPPTAQMLLCKSDFCAIKQFHMNCLGITKVPRSWTCPNCRTVLNKQKRDKKKENKG